MDVHKYWVEPVFKSLPRDARIKLVANVEAAMMRTGTATKITLSEYASTDEYAYIRCLENGDNDMTEKVYAAFQGLSVDEKNTEPVKTVYNLPTVFSDHSAIFIILK